MTASGRYPLLFSPLRLGPVVVPNRVVFSAHLTNYAVDGMPSDQHAAYYEARARGGAGLIVTEEHSTHPTDWPYEKLIHGFRPQVVDGYRRITAGVHRHGASIFAQINHNGSQGSSMYSRLPVWGPSPVFDPLFREVPKEVDESDIDEVVAGYALVAGHCAEGGFDGVELQCSHSSIVRCFLSPVTNRRDDLYGGCLANRARLLLRLVAAVRDAIGPGMALGVRLCGDELIDGGTTIDDAVAVAAMVEEQGLIDYVNTSIGVATASLFMIEASMAVPPGYALFVPSAIRKAIALPVVGSGRFKDPLQAERALEAGHCDLVGVVRGQIADPDFAAKARAGRAEDIRLCLSCNQECVGRMGLNRWLGCIENPHAGREATTAPPLPSRSRRVVVAGAGPAGLQAAATAAGRGHRVLVVEKEGSAGGQARLAASVASRAEFADIVRNLVHACARAGVEVRYGVEASAASLLAEGPDAVVLATGALPQRPPWATGARVADVSDVLSGRAHPGGRVLVVDELGFHQATSVAQLLADRGAEVTVTTSGMVVGQDLGITLDIEHWNFAAAAKGITQLTDLVPMAVSDGGVDFLHHPTGAAQRIECDWVVSCSPPLPAEGLYFELKDSGVEVHRAGDCVAPRRAHAAVVEGHRVGMAL